MSYRRQGRDAPRWQDRKQDGYYEESVASQTIMPGDSPFAYVTAGSPRLTYEELCRRAAIIERETREKGEKPKKNPYPTAGAGEQGGPSYFHPRYSTSNLPSSRGSTTVIQPQRYASPTSPSQRTPRPDSHDPRMDKRRGDDRDSVPSGQLVKRSSRRSQEGKRNSEGATSVQGSTSSRLPSNKPPSKDEQFGNGREYFQPPPLPYKPGTQSGPPTEVSDYFLTEEMSRQRKFLSRHLGSLQE